MRLNVQKIFVLTKLTFKSFGEFYQKHIIMGRQMYGYRIPIRRVDSVNLQEKNLFSN